jgi:dolichol-phosphate mannosyltransferase
MILSIIIPIYNEAQAIPQLLSALQFVLSKLTCDHEIVFVDDGSTDESLLMLERLANRDSRLKILAFPRNFGHQAAITAGLDFAEGDAVVVMDADLQDPPDVLARMLELYTEGYDVVSAQRVQREGDGYFKRFTARCFYWLMKTMVDERLPPEVGDFRLFSREALVAVRSFREQHRFVRGLVSWLGLREAIVPFERPCRVAGKTKYPLYRMLRFAWTAISSFSAIPLRISTVFGLSLCLGAVIYFIYAVYLQLVIRVAIPGWTSIVALQCLFSGVTLLGLGLVGDYVARIYEESKNRPLYVVSRVVNTSLSSEHVRRAVVLPRCNRSVATSVSVLTAHRHRSDDLEILSGVLEERIEKKLGQERETNLNRVP